jgi:octopine/nopaline transport system substrate-binding protein
MKRILWLGLWLGLVGLGASLAGAGPGRAEELVRIGTYRHYPPWTISAADGTLSGFEIDMTRELCRRMNVPCAISVVDWERVFEALEANEFDVYVGCMTITPERARRAAFSQPYAWTPEYFATTVGHELTSILTLNRLDLDNLTDEGKASLNTLVNALRGRKIGVHVETVYENFADQYLKSISSIKVYHTEKEKYHDMVQGRLDAILDGGAALHEFILAKEQAGQELTLFGPALVGGPFGRGVGAALRPQNTALREKLNAAIASAKADGTLARIALGWFGYNAAAE